MKRILFYLLIINSFAFLPYAVHAQVVSTGHESARGDVNFTDLANYLLAHPEPFHLKELENDEDEPTPVRPPVSPSLVRYRTAVPSTPSTYTPTTLLPVSPAPTDTFNSALDNGSSFPPDTHGSVDSNYCVTTVNEYVKIHTRAGAVVSKVSLDAFWSSVWPGGGTFDPRVHYDPYYHRWILVADADGQLATSSLLIAVSKTSNPTAGWWLYVVPIAASGYWLDYPNVGFNQKWVVVTGNLFGLSSGYGGCKVYAFNYANLMSGAGAPYTAFTQSSSECIAPTLTYDPTLQNIYGIESWDGSAFGGGQMRLWKISGAVGSETMTSVGYPAASYNWQGQGNGGSDFAPQLGTSNLIQTNDDRIFSCVYMNGKIWFTHNVFFPATGATTRCSSQWWQIDTFGTPAQIGLVDDPTNANFFAFPSIAVNSSNDALIGFTQFSSTTHPNAAYAVHMHTDPTDSVRPYQVYRHGQYTYYRSGGGRDRWGDYSAANIDPVNMTDFWTIQETCDSVSNRWDTWWAYVNMCNIVATITPAGPTTFCAGNSVTLNATTGAGYSYQWQLGGSPIAGATGSSYTATTAGGYSVVITSGCSSTSPTTTVSVNPNPAAIGGSLNVCVSGTTTLTDATTPGTWSSVTPGVATIGSASGLVNGIFAGTSVISYTLGTGCYTTATVTVNNLPTATITPAGPTTFCAGGSVTLNATTGTGYAYQWQVGGSNISGATNASYVANATGNYTLVVTANGCSTTSAITAVTVNPNPSAITSSSGLFSLCSGATVTLNSTPAGGSWTSTNPSVASISGSGVVTGIGSGGTSNITYTLGTGCYAATTVTVNSTSAAAITGSATVCATQTTTLSDATPSGTWSSTNPLIATVGPASGIVTGISAGTVTISYIAATSCGTGFATLDMTINPTPTVAAITGTTAVCVGGTSTLADATPAGVWTSNNTSIASVGSTTGVASGVVAGSTTIRYTVTNASGCSATSVTTVNVFSSFTATATPAGPTSFCTGGSVVLNASSGPGYSYQWEKNGVNIAGATTLSYTATTTGNYSVYISNTSGCNSTSGIVAVNVNPSPIVAPSVSVNATPSFQICVTPTPITLTAVPTNGGSAPTYQWYVGSTLVGSGSTYGYLPAAGDSVTVVMTSNDACAFPVTASRSNIITLIPTYMRDSVGIVSHLSPICAGDSVKFSAVPFFGGSAPTYLWTKNGVNVATGPDYIYVPLNGDHLVVTMTSNYPCVLSPVVTSLTFPVTVQNDVANSVVVTVSQSSIAPGITDTFTAVAINGGSSPAFQWLRNGVIIPGATAPKYVTNTLANGDIISCMETSNAPCASPATVISSGIRMNVWGVGVSTVTGNSNITIQPNPNKGEFTIDGSLNSTGNENVNITITDMLGQTVYTKAVVAKGGNLHETVMLDNAIANGMYLVSITSTDGRAVYHVVVSR